MTKAEILKTRVIVSKSVKIEPDRIKVISKDDCDKNVVYVIDNFNGMNLVIGFDKVPSIIEAREEIKSCYLGGCEMAFDMIYKDFK